MSAHIKLPKVPRSNGAVKPKKGRHAAATGDDSRGQSNPLVATDQYKASEKTAADALMDKFPAFDPAWPEKIQEQWFAAFAKMQDMVKDK